MAKVFISHSWKDNDISRKIARYLKQDGAEIWIDYARIKPGEGLPDRIGEALEWCDTLVLVWSKSAADSYYVGLEWQSALDLQKSIIPCIIDETKRPAILRGFLYIDFNNFDRGYQQLFQAMELKHAKPTEQQPKPVEKVEEKREVEKQKKQEIKFAEETVRRERVREKEKQKELKIKPPDQPVRSDKVREKQKILKIVSIFIAILIIGTGGIYLLQKFLLKSTYKEEKVTDQKFTEDSTKTKTVKGMTLVFISGGTFDMGDTFGDGDADEKPVRKVTVKDFYMSNTEVTNTQYAEFLNAYGKDTDDLENKMIYEYKWGVRKSDNRWQPQPGYENHPVVYVTWYGATQFAKWAGCRLPNEAEWEYAACSGERKEKWAGTSSESSLGDFAWYNKNSNSQTHPVAGKKSNSLGLYDLAGNVWEWCRDWYAEKYDPNDLNNPKGPSSGQYRVLRGGSWISVERNCRSTNRYRNYPVYWGYSRGFRVVQDSPH